MGVLEIGGSPLAGSKQLLTTVAAAISTTLRCKGVIVNNPSTNLVAVNIGDSAAQTVELLPGASITIPTSDLLLVFAANASSATQTIGWIAIL